MEEMFEAAFEVVSHENNLKFFKMILDNDTCEREFSEEDLNALETLIPQFNP